MKFRFPDRIDLTKLTHELEPLVETLHEAGISMVCEVQISLRGFSDKDEFHVRAPGGEPITLTYRHQRLSTETATSVPKRVPFERFEITKTPPSGKPRGLSALFERD